MDNLLLSVRPKILNLDYKLAQDTSYFGIEAMSITLPSDNKVKAIKIVRTITGMGPAACKYMVDRLFEEGRYVQIVDELTDYNYKRIASRCEELGIDYYCNTEMVYPNANTGYEI